MFKLSILTRILVFSLFLCAAVNVHGVAFNVNTNGDTVDASPGNGVCADASGNCTLRAAVIEANALASDDEIAFSPTLSGQTITLGSVIAVFNNGTLRINGLGANVLTVSGNNATRIFTVNTNANATISRLTITNGAVSGTNGTNGTNGTGQIGGTGGQTTGGVLNSGTLTLSFVIVRNCFATGGRGGDGGSGTTGASGGNGGAGGQGGSALGGGIYNTRTLYLLNSTVSANQATGTVGGRGGNGGGACCRRTALASAMS